MTSLTAFLGPASLWGLGLLITSRFSSVHPTARLGMAYGIGAVWIMLVIGVMGLVGLPISTPGVFLAVLALAMVVWVVRLRVGVPGQPFLGWTERGRRKGAATRWVGLGMVGALGLLVATTIAALTLFRTWIRPITGWDVWADYSIKAKIIYGTETIPRFLFEYVGTPNYPLGGPLQQVWAALVAGSWNETAIKLIAWGYFPSLGLVAYGTLRRQFASSVALLGALFVGALPLVVQHSQEPYINLPLAYFVLGQSVALTHYVRGRSRQGLLAAALFGVGAVLTRMEGTFFVITNVILLTYLKAPAKDRLVYLGPAAVVWGVWAVVRPRWGVDETVLISNLSTISSSADRVWPVAAALGQALFMSGNWMIVWPLFIVAFLMRFRSTFDAENIFSSWPVVIYLCVLAWLFVTQEGMFSFLAGDAMLHRLILHVAPLAALWVAFFICAGLSERLAFRAVREKSSDT
jgi:hypothetical protein